MTTTELTQKELLDLLNENRVADIFHKIQSVKHNDNKKTVIEQLQNEYIHGNTKTDFSDRLRTLIYSLPIPTEPTPIIPLTPVTNTSSEENTAEIWNKSIEIIQQNTIKLADPSTSKKEKKILQEEIKRIQDEFYSKIIDKPNKILQQFAECRENEISILFEKVYAMETFTPAIYAELQTFRNNDKFAWYDRSVLVSAITLSLLSFKKFDAKKVDLLLDFITDFEENVWQKALTGLYIGLYFHHNRIARFQLITKRLQTLQQLQEVQDGLYRLDIVCRNELFKNVLFFENGYQNDFFADNIANCFLPFYADNDILHKAINENVNDDINANDILENISQLPYIDAFKYHQLVILKNKVYKNEVTEKEKIMISWSLIIADNFAPYLNFVAELYCFDKYYPLKSKFDILQNQISLAGTPLDDIILNKENELRINAEYYHAKNEYSRAINYYEKLLPLTNNKLNVNKNIGNCYTRLEKYYEALKYYLEAEKLETKQDIELWTIIAACYFSLKKYEQGILYFQKVENIDSNNIDNLLSIASSYEELKDYDNALLYCDKALEIDNNNAKIYHRYRSIYGYRNLNNFEKSYEYALKAVEIEPNNVDYLENLAVSLGYLNRFTEALDYARKAEAINPKHEDTIFTIGRTLLLGNIDKAESKSYLDKAVKMRAANIDYGNLGHWYLSEGNREKAMGNYRKCVYMYEDVVIFSNEFMFDLQYLTQYGITNSEYEQIRDELVAYWHKQKKK
jgi:tetratricopeptide (TPR) repeat protein